MDVSEKQRQQHPPLIRTKPIYHFNVIQYHFHSYIMYELIKYSIIYFARTVADRSERKGISRCIVFTIQIPGV